MEDKAGGWLLAPAVPGVDPDVVTADAGAGGTGGTVEADGADDFAGTGAGLPAAAGIALAVASFTSSVLASRALLFGAGSTMAGSSCVMAAAAGAATAAGVVVPETVAVARGAGACHSRWPATAAIASSSTPPVR